MGEPVKPSPSDMIEENGTPPFGSPPFLRSPPFPGIAPSVAAISEPATHVDRDISDDLFDLIRDARVGGAFWAGSEDPWTRLAQAQSVEAGIEDELALVAGLLEVPVIGPDGVRINPDLLRATLKHRIGAAHYRDCFTGEPVGVEHAVAQLADWRRHLDGNQGIAAATGMAFWKREAIRHFLWDGQRSPPFLSPRRGLRRARYGQGALAIWPSRVPPTLGAQAQAQGVALARVEDGFLRSRGLGAALHPPGSIVVDRSGIYYNALAANDLETLLATQDFPPALVERAARLRGRICASGVTKYGQDAGQMLDLPTGRRTVLAIGQVDDDLSVQLGGAGVADNLDFLARVRRAEPDAWIIYRPHPDVQAGHRKGHLADATVLAHADAIDSGSPLMALVQAVHEVHVLSSLTGFEALMRGCRVTVHGMPFYAGWGLTRDLAEPVGRRGRRLLLDELVAAALILYPRYLDPVTRLPCGPEVMTDRLASGTMEPTTWLIRLRSVQGKLRRFMTLTAEYVHG
jgi:capsular polysaccharide export protein